MFHVKRPLGVSEGQSASTARRPHRHRVSAAPSESDNSSRTTAWLKLSLYGCTVDCFEGVQQPIIQKNTTKSRRKAVRSIRWASIGPQKSSTSYTMHGPVMVNGLSDATFDFRRRHIEIVPLELVRPHFGDFLAKSLDENLTPTPQFVTPPDNLS